MKKQSRIRTISRRYYKGGKFKITYYNIYDQGCCKMMESNTGGGYKVIGHVHF